LQNRYGGISIGGPALVEIRAMWPAASATIPQGTARQPWATLALMSFSGDDLAAIGAAEEVRIETQAPGGETHRTIVWIMVDDGEVFVRSVNGEDGRWYREAKANPAVAIHVDGRRLAATAIPADDPDSIDRVSAALNRKYAGHGGSLRSMLQPHNLATTLRLEPA
jgi:hypothetical protein